MQTDLSPLLELVGKLPERAPIRPRRTRERRMGLAKETLRKLLRLRMEGLRLYQAGPAQDEFHRSRKKWRVLDGSNRSGKTLGAAVEVARLLTGTDPYHKLPQGNIRGIAVGLGWPHVADPMWTKLGEQGAFKIVKDEHTRLWRAVRANPADPAHLDPYDDAYREKWRDAPPILPPRLIREIAWEDAKNRQPKTVRLHDNSRLEFCSSDGKPRQGQAYHFGWLDEQLERGDHYREMTRGLMDFGGGQYTPLGIWSATPQNCNPELLDLRERADRGDPYVGAFMLLIEQNPHISDEEKLAFFEGLSEEERAVRYFGQYAEVGRRIYATYSAGGHHGCDPFEVPIDWTRYIYLDPGRQYCGTVLLAIDPEERHCWVYEAFVLRSSDAAGWAAKIKQLEGGVRFERAYIDARMGKQHGPGNAYTVAEMYFNALKREGVIPREPGGELGGFYPACDDILAREEALISWLRLRPDGPFAGTPVLQVMRDKCPELDKQIRHAHYRIDNPDKRAMNLQEDVLVCAEYAAASRPYYQPPLSTKDVQNDRVWEAYQEKLRRTKQRAPFLRNQGVLS